MADLRCPMCGKPNPADREVCQFCQARLKPLVSSFGGESEDSESRAGLPDNELPDWLKALRQKNTGEQSTAGEPFGGRKSGEEDALPEWLRGDPSPSSGTPPAPQSDAPEPGLPDWLSGLRDQGAAADEPQADESTGWPPEGEKGAGYGNAVLSGAEFGGDDWLNGMRSDSGAAAAGGSQADDESDWLKGTEPQAGEPAGSVPDWVNPFRSGLGSELEADDFEPLEAEPAAATPQADIPDWLNALKVDNAEPEPPAETDPEETPPAAPGGEPPDWMSQFNDPTIESTAESGDIPDWMAQFGTGSAESDPASEPETPPAEETFQAGGLNTWFAQEETADDAGQDLPDWMAGLTGDQPDETPAGEPETFEPEEAGQELPQGIVPDWLLDLEGDSAGAEAFEFDEEPASPAEAEPETEVPSAADEFPDWMGPLTGGAPPFEEPAEAGNLTPKDDIEDDLAWLHALESSAPPLPNEAASVADFASRVDPFFMDEDSQKELEPLFDAEMPDWLAQVSPDASADPSGMTPEEASLQASLQGDPSAAEPNLELADLPNWLQAMRPTEPQSSETAGSGETEAAGPLTGLRGVLKAEPEITRVSKPLGQSLKLDVTPAQQAHVDLLLKMIQAEGEPRPLPARPSITPQHVLRIVMALVLIAAIVWPLVTGFPAVSLPAFPAEMAPVVEQINGLQPGAPVLVAVDYEPGLSGELDPLAASLVHHLMLKEAHLTLVSTSPNGPAQAERLIGLAYSRLSPEGQYAAERYANLGYIPGGAAGLLSFAENPARLLPFTVQGDPAWEGGPLSRMSQVRDFALLLVITHDPDDARVWIEQVQPRLEGKPLLMATSAQAAPLVLPYWTNGANQVQGIVSGLAGGASYEQILGRTAEAQAYWPAYSMGLLAAAGLILTGGLYNLVAAGFSRRKPPAGAQPERRSARKSAGGKAPATAEQPAAEQTPAAGEADASDEAPAAEAPEQGRAKQKKAKGKRKP